MKSRFVVMLLAFMASSTAATEAPAIEESSVFELRDSLDLLTATPHLVSAAISEACVSESVEYEGVRSGLHANVAVNFYVSPDGVPAMSSLDRAFPIGTIVLKEKLAADYETVVAVGGMVKRSDGFDPEHGNWEYFYAEKSGGFDIGRIPSCVSCHARARSSDHVYNRARTFGLEPQLELPTNFETPGH